MTSELRPAVEVLEEAARHETYDAAVAVIEADREAVRAPLLAEIERLTIQLEVESEPSPYCPICGSCGEDGCCGPQRCLYPTTVQAAELAKFKALAETLAGALEEIIERGYVSSSIEEERPDHDRAAEALRQYKEARDER